ncbi:acyltransferase family protein [Dokdonella sp. MW10]|uniref:acyltransferase family protein n=1 Tax=Dokdonella sp. MW10 TaxID=2992926 RepID=UPI003F7EB627
MPRWNTWLDPPPVLADRLGRGPDNVRLLRHVAAAMVVVGHSPGLAWQASGFDLLAVLLPGFYTGSVAVCVFFALSGCLLMHSWRRHSSWPRFALARVRRVYPAYLACLIFGVALGAAFTSLDLQAYVAAPELREHLWRNLDLAGLSYTLPGVFEHNRAPGVINGSLWSLALEVRLYVILVVLAAIGMLSRRRLLVAVVLAWMLWTMAGWWREAPGHQDSDALTALFFAGVVAAAFPERVWLSTRLLVVLGVVAFAAQGTVTAVPATMLGIGYAAFWLAWRVPPLPLPWRGDYSYGVFLYGFPVQQAIAALWPSLPSWGLSLVALPVALLLAAISWHALESRVLAVEQSPVSPKAFAR